MSDRLSHREMADEMDKMVWSKRTWLDTFAGKRPAHEIETKDRELAVLAQAAADYRRAAERQAA